MINAQTGSIHYFPNGTRSLVWLQSKLENAKLIFFTSLTEEISLTNPYKTS